MNLHSFNMRYYFVPYIVLLIACCICALDKIPESGWSSNKTVLRGGGADSWDQGTVQVHGVAKVKGTYFLFYSGGFDGCWGRSASHKSFGVATSTDGENFKKHSGNPVLKPHDFVPVSSHEEGIRVATVKYLPSLGKFRGIFGVESPGGSQTCGFMAPSGNGCGCNIEVDACLYAAVSDDGLNWKVEGEISDVGCQKGREHYIGSFEYSNGTYVVWSFSAQGCNGSSYASKGTSFTKVDFLGNVAGLGCGPGGEYSTYLHDDNNTVTIIQKTRFGTSSISNPQQVTNWRNSNAPVGRESHPMKDYEAKLWRYYHDGGSGIDMTTHALVATPIENHYNKKRTRTSRNLLNGQRNGTLYDIRGRQINTHHKFTLGAIRVYHSRIKSVLVCGVTQHNIK